MNQADWEPEFRAVYDRGVQAWKGGRRTARTMFTPTDVAFLATLGCSAQELFDFIDDAQVYGDLDYATTLAVTALRRDYFFDVQHGQPSGHTATMASLPAKTAAVDGIAWLPRLIAKARLKLRGEMPDDLMYGCAGDRPFLKQMRNDLPTFLRLVWESGDDDRRIVDTVKRTAGVRSP
jgi:hypothetical protein